MQRGSKRSCAFKNLSWLLQLFSQATFCPHLRTILCVSKRPSFSQQLAAEQFRSISSSLASHLTFSSWHPSSSRYWTPVPFAWLVFLVFISADHLNPLRSFQRQVMDNSSGECTAVCKSPPTSRSSFEDLTEEVGTLHECSEEKQVGRSSLPYWFWCFEKTKTSI